MFLSALPPDDTSRAQAEESFRRPAIFQKVCARELAARVSEARARLGTAPGDAVALLSSACADDPSEPTFRLDLAEALVAAGESERALVVLDETVSSGSLTRPLRGRAASLEASIHARAARLVQAQSALARAEAAATEDGDLRTARAKQRALGDEAARSTIGRVLFGDERGRPLDAGLVIYLVTEFARRSPDEALGPYLLARQLVARDAKLALPYLNEACPLVGAQKPMPLDSLFLKECRRLLGEAAYLAGDLATSHNAYGWLAEHAERESDRLRAQDFLQRVAWKKFSLMPTAAVPDW